jgi:hypothetical protein
MATFCKCLCLVLLGMSINYRFDQWQLYAVVILIVLYGELRRVERE